MHIHTDMHMPRHWHSAWQVTVTVRACKNTVAHAAAAARHSSSGTPLGHWGRDTPATRRVILVAVLNLKLNVGLLTRRPTHCQRTVTSALRRH